MTTKTMVNVGRMKVGDVGAEWARVYLDATEQHYCTYAKAGKDGYVICFEISDMVTPMGDLVKRSSENMDFKRDASGEIRSMWRRGDVKIFVSRDVINRPILEKIERLKKRLR